jgi:anaerobic ribonucleoside-triphosphate reductase activating protein
VNKDLETADLVPRLRISTVHFPVTALGPGTRLGVWVQGCSLGCPGCMSRDTWDPEGGAFEDVDALAERWRKAVACGAVGLTVSGGEPLSQARPLRAFLEAVRRVSAESGGEHDILLYTGFEPDELDAAQRGTAALADALVTGRFVAGEPTALIWRGSANQQLRAQTELGRRRYLEFVHAQPAVNPLQLLVNEHGLRVIGVPQRGTLARLDRMLRARGLRVDQASWRRPTPRK